MKKMIISVALMLATLGTMNAETPMTIEDNGTLATETFGRCEKDTFLMEVAKIMDTTPYVVNFYDVRRLYISNKNHNLIRVYDSSWRLVRETRDTLNLSLIAGNYHVACDTNMKPQYIEYK